MRRLLRPLLCSIAFGSCLRVASEEPLMPLFKPPAKKLIECSWANCDTAFLRQNIETMEKLAPYDGIRIQVDFKAKDSNGRIVECSTYRIFKDVRWQYAWFKQALEDLQATKFTKFKHNFLMTSSSTGNIDWFDDKAWNNVCNNFSIMARLAREGGMVGLFFDPETYNNNKQFRHKPEEARDLRELVLKTRQRGREFGQAIFEAFPNIKLFMSFIFESNLKYVDNPVI